MKVIKNKYLDIIETECPHCHSVLGVECNDITVYELHHGPTTTCKACGNSFNINFELPKRWTRYLYEEFDDI